MMTMSFKKKVVIGLSIIVLFGLIPLVGITGRINDNLMMKATKSNTNNLLKVVKNDNVTVTATATAIEEAGDGYLSAQQPPNASAAHVTTGFILKREQVMKAGDLKEQDEEIMSAIVVPKGVTAVKQLFTGRITEGRYGIYTGTVTSLYGLVATTHKLSLDTFVKHTVAFLLTYIVNLLIAFCVMTSADGQMLSSGWYIWLENIFCFTLVAGPLILVHCFIVELYTVDGVRARIQIWGRSRAEVRHESFIERLQRGLVATFTHGLGWMKTTYVEDSIGLHVPSR